MRSGASLPALTDPSLSVSERRRPGRLGIRCRCRAPSSSEGVEAGQQYHGDRPRGKDVGYPVDSQVEPRGSHQDGDGRGAPWATAVRRPLPAPISRARSRRRSWSPASVPRGSRSAQPGGQGGPGRRALSDEPVRDAPLHRPDGGRSGVDASAPNSAAARTTTMAWAGTERPPRGQSSLPTSAWPTSVARTCAGPT